MTVPWESLLKATAAVVLTPIIGALIMGVDRIITARMQNRIGPPLLQPFHDIIKLLRKQPVVVNRIQVLYVIMHLAFMVLATVLVVFGQDALMLLFILAFSTLSLVLGGMSVRSPYSRLGSQREIILMVAYEPILILMVVGFYLTTGSFQLKSILDHTPLLTHLPLIFLAYLLVVMAKMQKSPFDIATSHHAHQELIKGITIEFSGPYLALIEITHCYETALFIGLAGLFWASNLWIASALALVAFLVAIVADNVCARLRTLSVFKLLWTLGLGLALTNIIWLYW